MSRTVDVDVSETMVEALALAHEDGELVRQPGGFWTPPDEPMRGKRLGPEGGRERYAKTTTVDALRRRDLLTGSNWNDPAKLTIDGRRVLEANQ